MKPITIGHIITAAIAAAIIITINLDGDNLSMPAAGLIGGLIGLAVAVGRFVEAAQRKHDQKIKAMAEQIRRGA